MWAYVARLVDLVSVVCLQQNPLLQEPNLSGTSLIFATLLPGMLPLLPFMCSTIAADAVAKPEFE